MKEYAYRMEIFQPFEFVAMERRLSAMARRGLQLEEIGSLFWKYRRGEPCKTSYAVTYLPQGSMFDPLNDPKAETLRDLCAEAGWEKVCDWGQLQVYRTDRETPVPIETDESDRLTAIRRSMRKLFLLPNAALFFLAVFELGQLFLSNAAEPLILLSSSVGLLLLLLMPVLLLMLLLHFFAYAFWLRRSLKSVAQGGRCVSSNLCRRADTVFLVLALLVAAGFVVFSFLSGQGGAASYFLLYFFCILGMAAALNALRRHMRREGFSRGGNRTLFLLADVVLAVVFAVVMGMSAGDLIGGENPEPKQFVRVQSLASAPSESWYFYRTDSSSPLLSRQRVQQYEEGEGDGFLLYEVYTTPLSALSDWCAEQLLAQKSDGGSCREANAVDLPVDTLYCTDYPSGNRNWILAGEGRVLSVTASWMLEEEDLLTLWQNA